MFPRKTEFNHLDFHLYLNTYFGKLLVRVDACEWQYVFWFEKDMSITVNLNGSIKVFLVLSYLFVFVKKPNYDVFIIENFRNFLS